MKPELTPADARSYGNRVVWGYAYTGKPESMGATHKHAFPDLSNRSLCGRYKEGILGSSEVRTDVGYACKKCRELHAKNLAGTWSPPPRRS